MAKQKQEKPLRVAGYCRTSSEGQRDNTSIPRQREEIERHAKSFGWTVDRWYVDECRSGSKIEGREEFQRMMRDAANDEFDIVVVYDITRFGRDGFDIIESANTLRREFGVRVMDTRGTFDNGERSRVLTNFVGAGMAEHERLAILERTNRGRIARAREGKPWSPHRPIGRDYDKASGTWYVTDKGKAIAEALRRYLQGEGLTELCRELGLGDRKRISEWVANGQLTGTYVARFHSSDIGIDESVKIPAIPSVVEPDLLAQVRARLLHNRTCNRTDAPKYVLSGFIRCDICGMALTGQTDKTTGIVYYRHKATPDCSIVSVRGDAIEPAVLDYFYGQFLDRPAFEKALMKALPTAEDRDAIESERRRTEERLAKVDREISNLVNAIAQGAAPALLIDKQDELLHEKSQLRDRFDTLDEEIANMPSAERIAAAAAITRTRLMLRYWQDRDWRKMSIDDIKPFLLHLFGETSPKTRNGVSVGKNENGFLVATFKGNVPFDAEFHDGRVFSKLFLRTADAMNAKLQREVKRAVAAWEAEFGDSASDEDGPIRPFRDTSQSGRAQPARGNDAAFATSFDLAERSGCRCSCRLRRPGLQAIRATQAAQFTERDPVGRIASSQRRTRVPIANRELRSLDSASRD